MNSNCCETQDYLNSSLKIKTIVVNKPVKELPNVINYSSDIIILTLDFNMKIYHKWKSLCALQRVLTTTKDGVCTYEYLVNRNLTIDRKYSHEDL